jgi:hypothetical protein
MNMLLTFCIIATTISVAALRRNDDEGQDINDNSSEYASITLTSDYMSVQVYMPMEGKYSNDRFYTGSRFEHASMIGDFVIGGGDSDESSSKHRGVGDETPQQKKEIYGHGLWRQPHNPNWPESGVGLASEFGCGHDGVNCVGKGDIVNGVLGYDTARAGEPFLKIGVGVLIKGSCPDCNSDRDDDHYRFNSPYEFYRPPSWKLLASPGPNEVTFYSEERLGQYGYAIQKTTRLDGNVLTVRTLLTNLGKNQFATPWYSHNFFNGNREPIGPGYVLNLGLSEYGLPDKASLFKQPGLNSWSGDIEDYFDIVAAHDGSISLRVNKPIPDNIKLKADFLDESTQTLTDGSFTLHAPNGVTVYEKIPEMQTSSRNPFIYAYSVYAERGALCPEPVLLLYLQPAETTFWTQNLRFSTTSKAFDDSSSNSENRSGRYSMFLFPSYYSMKDTLSLYSFSDWQFTGFDIALVCLGVVILASLFVKSSYRQQSRRVGYASIPPHEELDMQDVVVSGDVLSSI